MFNILGEPPSRVLDLFAGSGLLGIEALSRGASAVHFVDSSKTACRQIQRNIESLSASESTQVLCSTVIKALPRLERPFGWIFLDPPYSKGLVEEVLIKISRKHLDLIEPSGLIIAEHETRLDIPQSIEQLERVDLRHYGDSSVSFFKPRGENQSLQ